LDKGYTPRDLLLALALAAFWGSTYPMIRVSGSPGSVLIGRYAVSSIISLAALLRMLRGSRGGLSIGVRDAALGSLAGLFNLGFVVCMYYALLYIPSGPVSAIIYTYPLLMILISSALGFQKIGLRAAVGSLIAFSGVLAIYAPSRLEPAGVILSLLASLFFAISSVISSRASLDAAALASLQNIAGFPAAVLAYIALGEGFRVDPAVVVAITHQGVGAGYIAYLAWYALIKRSIGVASSLVYMVPAAAFLIAIPIAGEVPEIHHLVGLALILAGIYTARRS